MNAVSTPWAASPATGGLARHLRGHRRPAPRLRTEVRPGRGNAVVIGGGLAGMLAAWALRGYADTITVIERDHYPPTPEPRAGVPQARHAHLLLEAGHRALEAQLPGVRDELLAAGAVRVAMSRELRWLSSAGWMVEHDSELSLISCTRPLLDHTIRARVLAHPCIRVLPGCEVTGLLGDTRVVTGVRWRQRGARNPGDYLPAELVVDASGRSSSLPDWLTGLGCGPVRTETVDPGVAYTSRMFHRPDIDLGFKALYLQTRAPDAPVSGSLLPVEGDRWIVSLGGMRGTEPGQGEAGFTDMLARLRDPILAETLRGAEPAGRVAGFRPGPNVRRQYHRRSIPAGLVVLGDAAVGFNPVYGQGMTVAALGAHALRVAVQRYDSIDATAARAARRGIAAAGRAAWMMSIPEDARFPHTVGGPRDSTLLRLQHRFFDRLLDRTTSDTTVATAVHRVMTMTASPASLLHPTVLAPVLSSKAGRP